MSLSHDKDLESCLGAGSLFHNCRGRTCAISLFFPGQQTVVWELCLRRYHGRVCIADKLGLNQPEFCSPQEKKRKRKSKTNKPLNSLVCADTLESRLCACGSQLLACMKTKPLTDTFDMK